MKNITIENLALYLDEANQIGIKMPENNTDDLKIIDATIKVKILEPIEASNYQVKFLSNNENSSTNTEWLIDQLIDIKKDDEVSINISDEFQYCLDNSINRLNLKFIGINNIEFDLIGSLKIDFIDNTEFQGNGNKKEINLGKAGTSTVNLVSGTMAITTPLMSSKNETLPFSINANYNSIQNNLVENTGLPNGWSLNFNQFLIKNKPMKAEDFYPTITIQPPEEPDTSINDINILTTPSLTESSDNNTYNKETILSFTYIDSTGKNQIIEEKYYVNDKQIDRDDLSVDFDGNLIYIDEEEIHHNVITKLEAPSGLTLVSSIKGLKGSNLVDYEPNELAQQRSQLKTYRNNLKQYEQKLQYCKEQLALLSISRCSILKQLELQDISINLNENDITFYNNLKDLKVKAINTYTTEQKALSVAEFEHTYGRTIDDKNSNHIGTINFQTNMLRTNKSIYFEPVDETEFRTLIRESVPEEFYRNILEKRHTPEDGDEIDILWRSYQNSKHEAIDDGKLSDKDLYSCDIQIKEFVSQYYQYKNDVDELNDLIKKLEHNVSQLEMQVPIHYLYDENNIIYGFGKTNNENVFRLILITDSYGNNLFFNFSSDESNKIKSISDSNETYATFNYDKNDILVSIQDSRDNIIKLNYDDNKFVKSITFADNSTSYYYYNNDNKLTTIINQTGFGIKFTYTTNKVSKIEYISILDRVENGKIFYKEINQNVPNYEILNISETSTNENYNSQTTSFNFEIDDFTPYIINNNTLNITYNNYKSTTITNARNKSITYNFDKYGNTTTIYENKILEKEDSNNTKVIEYVYSNNLLSEKITKFLNSENYLANISFNPNNVINTDSIVVGETICGDSAVYEDENRKNIFKISDFVAKSKFESINVPNDKILEINSKNKSTCNHKIYIVSGWAKADSAFVIVDEDENKFANYIRDRKFQIKVDVIYEDETKTFSKSFDWRNTDWQYCAVPIVIENKEVKVITCSIDYRYNTGSIYYTNLDFYEGDYEHVDYNDKKQPILKYSGHSKWQTKYEYDENDNLIKEIVFENKKDKIYVTNFEYNKNGKLLRTTNYNGIIKENIYNDKGKIIKTLTYHKDEPTNVFFEEHNFDENGNEKYSTNDFGDELKKYEYLKNTNIIQSSTDYNGNKTSYGYDKSDTLLQTSTTINGIENVNTYGYTLDFLTKLKHNDFDINYDYDGLGRLKNIDIAGNNYLSNEYNTLNNINDSSQDVYNSAFREEITTLANGEIYKKVYNENDNLIELYYKTSNDTTEFNDKDIILKNTYDNIGNLIKSSEIKNNKQITHLYSIDKFGNTTCEEMFVDNNEDDNPVFKIINLYDNEHDKIEDTTINVENESLKYHYDYTSNLNKSLQTIKLPNNFNQNIIYDKLNRLDSVSLVKNNTNILTKKYKYLKNGDHTSNLVSTLTFSSDIKINNETVNLIKDTLTYKYDKNGNITEIRQTNNLITRYGYDSLNRLIREDNKKLNFTKIYFYDAGGNITLRKEYEFTLVDNLDYANLINEHSYSYPINAWKDQLVKYDNETFEYDELGNPTIYRDKQLKWSFGRQLDKFDNVTFKYNADGIRTSKIENSIYTKYYLNGNKIVAQFDTNDNLLYFHYGVDGLTGFKLNGIEYFYKKNIQNDIIAICDINGQEIVKYIYDAWGNHIIKILNNKNYVDISTITGNNEYVNIANLNPFRYRSYYYDKETKLYYLNSRYYDSELGRFINADDISTLNITKTDFNGINLYAYCLNNPVNSSDSCGYYTYSEILERMNVIFETSLNLGIAGFASVFKNINPESFKLLSNSVSNVAFTISAVAAGVNVLYDLFTDVDKGYDAGQIVSNIATNSIIYAGVATISGAIGTKIGAAVGSLFPVPFVGTAIGAGIGFVIGTVVGAVLNIEINGKTIINHIRDAVYDFWRWLFG